MDKSNFNLLDKNFKRYWKQYLFQSFLGGIALLLGLLLISIQKSPVIISSLGATCFIVFATPGQYSSTERNILGGHFIGILSGSLFNLIPHGNYDYRAVLIYAGAVVLSIFLMAITDTEHPPGSATALGMTIQGFSIKLAGSMAICVLVLAISHYLFKDRLRDLL